MALDTRTRAILKLPKMTTSRVRELQWGIDWWNKCRKEAKAHEDLAWKLYNDAIDAQEPRAQIESLYVAAKMFEANRIAAYHNWQECKRQYLELMN